jgi:tellurite resistance protein TerC
MLLFWIGFLLLVSFFLALDLGVFNRKDHEVSMREALTWSGVWICTSLAFSAFVYFAYDNHWQGLGQHVNAATGQPEVVHTGLEALTLFLQCYILEWSLSVDNLFVIALIFGYFKIPRVYQHRVLFWGILGAVLMRGVFITLGSAIVQQLHWIIYLFGAFLLYTAWKMLTSKEDADISQSRMIQFVQRRFRVTPDLHGRQFLVKLPDAGGVMKNYLTPLALALIIVEGTDLIFAVDSIPAAIGIFGRTPDSFLIFTSNVFAVLGLRSMYFALAALMGKFHYLKVALAVILGVVGIKMLGEHWIAQSPWLDRNIGFLTLGFIGVTLATAVIASMVRAKRHPELAEAEAEQINRAAEGQALPGH